jgi:hypothetical protein
MAHPIKNSGMQVRGKAIVVIPGFIKKNFGEEGLIYWLSKITPEARHIYESKIDGNKWYSLKTVLIEPTANIAHLFYNWNLKSAAWELGRYSADNRFGGISKLLIKFPSPNFFVNKGAGYLSEYYRPCESRIVENSDGLSILHITCFPEMDSTTEFRIGGWIQRGLEINGCKNLQVNITKSLTRFDAYTEYQINWQSRGKSN